MSPVPPRHSPRSGRTAANVFLHPGVAQFREVVFSFLSDMGVEDNDVEAIRR
jgi:hypothetical protein